ncbi:MAG: hypothetical protein J5501_09810 [Ruminococcus sp.]|nr:hypothetical protein [Ruminococcus sp.]
MKKVKVRYTPSWFVTGLALTIVFLMIVLAVAMAAGVEHPGYMWLAVLSGVMTVAVLIASIVIEYTDTEVEICEDRLKCSLLGVHWEIGLSGLEKITYTVKKHTSQYTSWNTLDLIFRYGPMDGVYNRMREFSVKISTDDIALCMAGDADDVPVMQIYRCVAEMYPDAAGGYEKSKGFWG